MAYRSTINGVSSETPLREAIERLGGLENAQPVPAEIIARHKGRVPDLVLDLWENHGVGDLDGGRMRLCIPRSLHAPVRSLFHGDPDLGGDTLALAYGAFGDLVAWNPRHQMVQVNMQLSSVEAPSLLRPETRLPDDASVFQGLMNLIPGTLDAFDEDGQEMFTRARETYGPLPPLHIYAMFPPAPRDEAFALENHRPIDVDEWLSLKVSEAQFTLDDPDGGRFGLRPIGKAAEVTP